MAEERPHRDVSPPETGPAPAVPTGGPPVEGEPPPAPDPTVEPPAGEVAGTGPEEATGPGVLGAPLVAAAGGYRTRWEAAQAAFVDEPRAAVEDADQLVVEVVDEITEVLTRRREEVTSIWRHDPDASTEDLRRALQRYRALFDHLLSR